MSQPKKTSKEVTAEEQMEQRLQATQKDFDGKEHLKNQLSREDKEAMVRSRKVSNQDWFNANEKREEHNAIIGFCRDHLRKVYGRNCKAVKVPGELSHELVLDENGPFRVVPTNNTIFCHEVARLQLESILDQKEKGKVERDTIMTEILEHRYLDVVGTKEENHTKLIDFIVEESMVGFNTIIKRQEKKYSERIVRGSFKGQENFDFIWMG